MAPIKPNPRVKNDTRAATRILRDTVFSLLDGGFTKQEIADALARLAKEASGDDWVERLETRDRMRGPAR